MRDTVSAAIDAGVPVYAGTDAGGGIDHGRIVDEILALHRVGLDPERALGAASWSARSWLGWSALDEGSAADLLAFDSDPRANLETLRHAKRIVLRGRVIV